MSAMYYAMTKASFEEIALKFVQVDDSHALKTFLMKVSLSKHLKQQVFLACTKCAFFACFKKMSSLKSSDLAKITALVLWLIEIFLNELGSLRDFGKQSTADYNNLEEEFLHFMAQPLVKVSVVYKTILTIMPGKRLFYFC